MKLSIIVPVYNMASDGKLNYCLDSLAAQTISDYEVITVDDASTDESFSILLEYEKKYPGKFKAVHSEVNKRQGGSEKYRVDPLQKASGSDLLTATTGFCPRCTKS